MSKMTFDEWYGDITVAQQRAYKKHNVSPSDHDELVRFFGASDHAAITKAVNDIAASHGMFSTYHLY